MDRHRMHAIALTFLLLSAVGLQAANRKHRDSNMVEDRQSEKTKAIADRIFYREAQFIQDLKSYTPMTETYIQDFKGDQELGQVPSSDKYFIGRLIMKNGIENVSFQNRTKSSHFLLEKLNSFYKMNYVALGFMQMVYIGGFDQQNYDLKFIHQEFLGEVRTLAFDVTPKPKVKGPHFLGRIWVEDQDYTIVRFNGTYLPQRRLNFYFHFDAWRTNMRPGIWLPAFVYTEESDAKYALFRKLAMRGQTRL